MHLGIAIYYLHWVISLLLTLIFSSVLPPKPLKFSFIFSSLRVIEIYRLWFIEFNSFMLRALEWSTLRWHVFVFFYFDFGICASPAQKPRRNRARRYFRAVSKYYYFQTSHPAILPFKIYIFYYVDKHLFIWQARFFWTIITKDEISRYWHANVYMKPGLINLESFHLSL